MRIELKGFYLWWYWRGIGL